MKLELRRGFLHLPLFGIWKWSDGDFQKPIAIPIENAKVCFFVEKGYFHKDKEAGSLMVGPYATVLIQFDPAPADIVSGLKRTGKSAAPVARNIFSIYREGVRKLEALLRDTGRVKSLLSMSFESIEEFFGRPSHPVEWSIDGGPKQRFWPEFPKGRGKNPLFKAEQLITPAKWDRMRGAAENGDFPEAEVLELLKMRSKVEWREIKLAIFEVATIAESLLSKYALLVLRERGFSENKLNNLKDVLTFNSLLNVVLPLSLKKVEMKKVAISIQKVDTIRKIRNDLIHGNKTDKEVDINLVRSGIDGALKLTALLKSKLHET